MKITGILIILFGFVVSYYGGYHTNPSRTIASNSDESLVNPLIDNRKAMQARRHVWLNEDANRIFMSTFEFEEDLTGMSQVQWAVDQAQKGKTVDLVLDAAGHRLSDETILYMVENGVNVHIFSPSFSWRGYKARLARMYRDRPTRSFSLPSIEAAWRQLTYRMHDKILWNENPNHPAGGEVILGGRNARDSHYGIDMRVMSQTRKESGQKIDVINPAFEYEHEILVHNQDLHSEVQTYIDGFLESSHTERVKAGELRERLANSRKYQEKHGDSWKTKLAADKTQFDDGFKQFTSDMQAWNKSYLFAIQNADTQEINSKRLTKNLVRIFQEHADTLARLTEEGTFRPKVLLDLLQPLTGGTITGIVKDAISSEEGSKVVFEALTELMDQSTPTIEHNIRLGNLTEAKLNKFLGPLGAPKTGIAGKVSGIAQAIKNSSYSIGLDVNKYENLPKITGAALESMNEFIPTNEINWLKAAQEVDLSEFMHDTVTENAFRKKSMDELFELISNCREECVWNSQYGSLTPEAISAINNVIKKNSAMYRFINNQFRKPNNVVSAQEKAETIIKLFASNRSYLASRLSNEFIPVDLLKQDLKELKHELSKIFDGVEDGRVKLNSVFAQLSTGIKNKDADAFEKFSNRLAALVRSEKEHIANLIKDDADIVERVMLSMQGYIDEDPKGILPPHKKINFYFMTNDVDSWAVGADKAIHADFHKNILHEFRKMGPGLHVYGLNSGGRIHSKVAITESGMIISSMNADPRSEKFNTEVGVKVITKNKGSHITDQYKQHILSYMLNQRAHIKDGQLVREKQCFDALTTIARRVLYPIL